MNEDQKEKLGQLIDGLDNLAHALQIPIPPALHIEGLKGSLPEKVDELKKLYREITGENPWNLD